MLRFRQHKTELGYLLVNFDFDMSHLFCFGWVLLCPFEVWGKISLLNPVSQLEMCAAYFDKLPELKLHHAGISSHQSPRNRPSLTETHKCANPEGVWIIPYLQTDRKTFIFIYNNAVQLRNTQLTAGPIIAQQLILPSSWLTGGWPLCFPLLGKEKIPLLENIPKEVVRYQSSYLVL